MKINLLVIRTVTPEILKKQYELLGFEFNYHQHGNGPFHYASEQNEFVFEIYPLTKSMKKADNSIRLGFDIENIAAKIIELENSDWKILSKPKHTEWGLTALVKDLDGRKIELKNK
ncbi:glyoxalase/bleomycin resistance/extradiol dioxygenase family protein [Aquimarina sp. RZ0]|uniref:glyoxalase/bleomycin resistance/extradiol dioxygenase family protein n=1 Tax=Aquimarina sp. RZ0 TaxID=2607730 RepID=UPI0011F1FC03|nr:glyoxalase/bleomycin resistance/extradiol dioxygenase family protein [Aquimarina sp. RZ0]KAA1247733.1 glyoxalase/bleomycin resistance/extradiol dioxygenase family protein [Aquimarina sp. RZ0]